MTAQPLLLMTNDWRSFEAKPGVYEIHFPNGLFYIGKSINVKKRLSEHLARLKSKKHRNSRMQRTYNKHKNCSFNIISYCYDDLSAAHLEQKHIAQHKNNKKCANVALGDWVLNADYIEYFTKSTLWVHLPSGKTHLSPSKGTWSLEIRGFVRSDGPLQCAVANSHEHARELHLDYWRKWVKKEVNKLDKSQLAQREKEENIKKRWWYHMKNTITGRATLARNTYEWEKHKASEGWIYRRYGEQWPKAKNITPPKSVQGYHPTMGSKRWGSIGACAREINRSHMSVLKSLRKEHRACAGWNLTFCDD
jgi:hypothetical protein